MVLTNVYGVALTIRATLPHLLERGDGHFLDHQLGRRPAGAARLALLGDQVGGDGDRRGAARRSCARCTRTTAIRVTLIEPGMVDTPFFDNRPGEWALQDDDIARAVIYALEQPPGVDVNEILIRPTSQPI